MGNSRSEKYCSRNNNFDGLISRLDKPEEKKSVRLKTGH